jgi:hypothetical protein
MPDCLPTFSIQVVPSLDSPAWMFSKALSHRQKVMRLYKRCCREVQAWYGGGDRFDLLVF